MDSRRRVFNVLNAVKNKHISIKTYSGNTTDKKNDILILIHQSGNIRIEYILMSCNIMPNDVWGFRVTLCNYPATLFALAEDSLTFSFDHNYYDLLGWTAEKFGPLYIPCKGDTNTDK